ncbi:MAG: dTDP-4-dehydrorhamnose 3,5-epimerase [Candidatus Thorarchaeota archaeon]
MVTLLKFNRIKTPIDELVILEPVVHKDERGFFMEFYNKEDFSKLGFDKPFVQVNLSKSIKGVIRGLHFQIEHPQGKLVKIIRGSVYDVAVDLRKGSPTFKSYFGIELSDKNHKMLYIPEGFAHGFLALTEEIDLIYVVTNYYYEEFDAGIVWNDPEIMIQWPFKDYGLDRPLVSSKDSNLPKLSEVEIPFIYKKQ